MGSPFDTIVAPITALEGAVAVVRLSGPDSWAIASRVFGPWEPQPRFAQYGKFCGGDDGLCILFEEGHSYTGEQSVEMSVHGSAVSVRELVDACLLQGAGLARPGEFTERAFLNGRIDLTQAEGVRDTVEAQTSAQLRQANLLREGALRREADAIERMISGVLSSVEASVDFSEELGDFDRPAALSVLRDAIGRIEALLSTAQAGLMIRRGLRIAIVGPPNAGKSSLLNRLLGFDRSIVTEIPGTTRDFVEEKLELGGIPCVITDTAGLRESGDRIEQIGIERSRSVAESADVIWYVFDGAVGLDSNDEVQLRRLPERASLVANKADLLGTATHEYRKRGIVCVSAMSGQGIGDLVGSIADRLPQSSTCGVWINERHAPLLESSAENLRSARATLAADLPFDLVTVHLQAAIEDIGQITGRSASEDMLERIFRDFCIGK